MGVVLFWLAVPVVFCIGRAIVWRLVDGPDDTPRSGRQP